MNNSRPENICVELRALVHQIMRYVQSRTDVINVERITGTNGWIIAYIAQSDGDVYQRDLEKAFGITRSTASKVVDLMAQKGLVEKQSVINDGRLKRLALTPKASELCGIINTECQKVEKELLKGFEEAEIKQLLGYLCRIKGNIENTRDSAVDDGGIERDRTPELRTGCRPHGGFNA